MSPSSGSQFGNWAAYAAGSSTSSPTTASDAISLASSTQLAPSKRNTYAAPGWHARYVAAMMLKVWSGAAWHATAVVYACIPL